MQKFNRSNMQSVRSVYTRRKGDRIQESPLGEAPERSPQQYAILQFNDLLQKAEADLSVFSLLINQSTDILFVADSVTADLLYVNEKTCSALLYSREELLALRIPDICASMRNAGSWEQVVRTVRKDGRLSFETEYSGKTGDSISVEVTLQISRHEDKEYILAAARDMMQLKQSDARLVRVTRALRTLSKCNEVIVHALDEQSLLNDVCRIVVEDGGYHMAWVGYRDDNDAKSVSPAAHAGHEAGYLNSIKVSWAENEHGRGPMGTAVRTGKPWLVRDVRADPSFSPWRAEAAERNFASVLALPIITKGNTLGAIAIYASEPDAFDREELKLLENLASNLSFGIMSIRVREEHRLVEKTLSQTLHELESIMLAIPDILFRTDLNANLVMWNKSLENFTGLQPEELLHRSAFSFFAELDRSSADAAIQKSLLQGQSEAELRMLDRSGKPVLFNWKTVFMKDERGNPIGLLGIARNITAHRRAEENQRALQAQLLQAQKMEAIGQLAGGIAHDFNNILTAIIGYGGIIAKKTTEPDKVRMHIDHIITAANRAANLTRSLLTFSRKQVINPQVSSVNTIVEGVEKLLLRIIGEDIELKTGLQSDIASVLVDHGQLEQVLMNLAANARDAMPGGGMLSITTGMAELDQEYIRTYGYGKPGRYVMITVSDTGTGMAEETRQRIFEPFFTTKDVGKGTGLGLSIAYGSVKQHNGYINAESMPGCGTTFKLYLPAVEDADREAIAAQSPVSIPGGTETILLAEDDSTVRGWAKNVLEESGYTVIEAVDGQDAVDKLKMHYESIQLLISDVIMPKKSGPEVFKEAKRIRPDIRALFASGYPAQIIKNRDVQHQAFHFLSKPVTPEQLLLKVREVLDA